MNNINENELKKINGGGISGWAIAGLGALVAFLSGLLDGIARPSKCN